MSATLAEFLAARALATTPFPLEALLTLYVRCPRLLYLDYFEGFKLLVKWQGPIAPSKLEPMEIPKFLCTYECQELGTILREHPSVIYQELWKLWKHSI